MSISASEHPNVALSGASTLSPAELTTLTAANSGAKPEESFEEALRAYRVFAIKHLREEMVNATIINDTWIRATLDTAWQLAVPAFRRVTGPMIAEAYIRAVRDVEQGDVPIQMIYALAEEHSKRVGGYFNETSSEALVQGFNTYVNRQVPAKAALERVVDAYGMTPRQMSGFTSATALEPTKMATSVPQAVKKKIKQYIGASISQRLKVFRGQEAHNLDAQANQVAWMWMVDQGKLPPTAQKMWLTAEDEKVCAQCGPLHRKKVLVGEKFTLPNGGELYVPGAHVNCRCVVRLHISPIQVEDVHKAFLSKADNDFDEREHPRGTRGRFVRKPRPAAPPVAERRRIPELERLERDVRQARQQGEAEKRRELEEEIARVQPAPEEPKGLGLTEGTTGLGLGLSSQGLGLSRTGLGLPSAGLGLGGGEASGLGLSPVTRQGLDLSAVKARGLDLTPIQRRGLQLQLQRAIEEVESKRPRITDEVRDTVRFQDEVGRPISGYAHIPMQQIDLRNNRVSLYQGDELELAKNDQEATERLLAQSIDEFNSRTKAEIARLCAPNASFAVVTRRDPLTGKRLTAEVDIPQLQIAIEASVNPKAHWAKHGEMEVEWTDSTGQVVYDKEDPSGFVSPLEMSELLGVNKDALEVLWVGTKEGYTGAYQTESGSRYGGGEKWSAAGSYKIIGERRDLLGPQWAKDPTSDYVIPIRILAIDPEVDTITLTEREMTDEEIAEERLHNEIVEGRRRRRATRQGKDD